MPHLLWEQSHWQVRRIVAGVDEAGRGAWAGPVVAAAVILPPDSDQLVVTLAGADDSKKMTPGQREKLAARIAALADVGIGAASAHEIDDVGILPATFRAMERALAALSVSPDFLLIDHIPRPLGAWPQQRLVRGDGESLSIAAASIIAKTYRDSLMVGFDADYPGYGFARHKGYGTAQHRSAIDQIGSCDIHRRSWSPFAQLRLPLEDAT